MPSAEPLAADVAEEQLAGRSLRVAMIGQKGVPASYGGIEHHVEELGARLAQAGVEVTVYCRASYADSFPRRYRQMRLVVAPTVASKHLDALVHSITSTVHALRSGVDVVHYHGLGPGLAAAIVRLCSTAKVVLTVHGLDHERAKWSLPARLVLRRAYWMSGHAPHHVIAISADLHHHYQSHFPRAVAHIPNGVALHEPGPQPSRFVEEHGLQRGRYVLFVGRLVPEKRPLLLLEACRGALPEGWQVVLVGDSSFSDDYVARLKSYAQGMPEAVLPGYVYGADLAALYSNCGVFVQPSDLEGLPLTLLEAIASGVPVVASDISPHREILDGCTCGSHVLVAAGDVEALRHAIQAVAHSSAGLPADRAHVADLLARYDWDQAAADVLTLYRKLTNYADAPARAH